MGVTFGDGVFGLLKAAGAVSGGWLPVFPTRQILLEQQARPAVVSILEQHAAVKLVEIGRGDGGLQGGLGDVQDAGHQRLSFFYERGGLIGFAAGEGALGVSI